MWRFALVSWFALGCDEGQSVDCIDPDAEGDRDADDCIAGVYVTDNEPGSFDADWLGERSRFTDTSTWSNPSGGAEISASIEPSSIGLYGGTTVVELFDGDGDRVGAWTLESEPSGDEVEIDRKATGAAGEWTVSIELIDFSGTGSVSVGAL